MTAILATKDGRRFRVQVQFLAKAILVPVRYRSGRNSMAQFTFDDVDEGAGYPVYKQVSTWRGAPRLRYVPKDWQLVI